MLRIGIAVGALTLVGLGVIVVVQAADDKEKDPLVGWSADFADEKAEMVSAGRNPYFVLEPGYVAEFQDEKEHVTITVLNETKKVDGVETRVVEERETKNGKLIEVSRNYFAISKRTNSVFYFGEDVDMYNDGKIANHAGSWLSGEKGARFGLMMPGTVLLRSKFYQEVAPGDAMDRAEVVSTMETVVTPTGTFKNCVKVEETTPLELGTKEYKYYAAGVGLVQDGDLKLVKYGHAKKPARE